MIKPAAKLLDVAASRLKRQANQIRSFIFELDVSFTTMLRLFFATSPSACVSDLKMKFLLLLLLWCVLFVLSWPIAVLALVLFPFVWLICLPLRLLGITVHAVVAFIKALLFLPARILGYRPKKAV